MALKQKIDKTAFDSLSDELKKEYKLGDNGAYTLDLDGVEDVGALTRARDREKEEAKKERARAEAAEKERDTLKNALGTTEEERARKAGDIVALENSWKSKSDEAVGTERKARERLEGALKARLVDDEATRIATAISVAPAVILPHIKQRLTADLDAAVPTTRVLDAHGALSALTLEDLSKEFIANPAFSAIIVGSKSTGGGASGGNQSGGGAPDVKFADMTGAERIAFHKRDPAGFKAASAAVRESVPRL